MSFQNCTHLSPACPLQATVYGYVPNLAGNITLLTIFAVCGISQLGLGIYYRSWSLAVAIAGGCFVELSGYVGRLLLHNNVWNSAGFRLQIVCLILAPSFIAAGIYLSLKHIILYLGPQHSRLQAKYYTWIFIGFDAVSILVQAAGGGMAGTAGNENLNLLNAGNNVMITGIAIQVVTMVTCGLLSLDFAMRYHKRARMSSPGPADLKSAAPGHVKAKTFFIAETVAYFVIIIRCIYRLPEMAGGWGNDLMRNEKEFLILDGTMVALAAIAFTVFHPGFWFPQMTGRWKQRVDGRNSEEGTILDGYH